MSRPPRTRASDGSRCGSAGGDGDDVVAEDSDGSGRYDWWGCWFGRSRLICNME